MEKIKLLSNRYDNDNKLSYIDRLNLYIEMYNFEILKPFAKESLDLLIYDLIVLKEYNILILFNDVLYNILGYDVEVYLPKKTLYNNQQNVHVFNSETIRVGNNLISKYATYYFRPKEYIPEFNEFFDKIEFTDLDCLDIKLLFSAIYNLIHFRNNQTEKDNMEKRLREEMIESINSCVTGCISRLVNSIRGFNTEYETLLDEYEYERSKAFYDLAKCFDPYDFKNINLHISNALNDKAIILPEKYAIRILNSYTGTEWFKIGHKYVYL